DDAFRLVLLDERRQAERSAAVLGALLGDLHRDDDADHGAARRALEQLWHFDDDLAGVTLDAFHLALGAGLVERGRRRAALHAALIDAHARVDGGRAVGGAGAIAGGRRGE